MQMMFAYFITAITKHLTISLLSHLIFTETQKVLFLPIDSWGSLESQKTK